ncbi:MAG: hypothetical protein M3Z75_26405 [Actinomycetota bacterium]|nr:hypothetical protein [Actinomycetota bacterium]
MTLGIILVPSGGKATKASPSVASSAAAGVSSSAVNPNCDIVVPAYPLTAQGLATPYQLTGPAGTTPAASGCQTINSINLGAFVQATILNPATGALSVYNPLVITAGTKPAVAPVVPKLPKNAIVTIDFGFNGTDLFQVGATAGALAEGNCVGGEPGSAFGQVSFCNGINFFNKAFALERSGKLSVPSAGFARKMVATAGAMGTGTTCPTTRNFDMIDQDPSDNVTTAYLLDPATGQTAQDTTANEARMPGATVLRNGSDNALVDDFLDPMLGCTPMEAPDLGNRGAMATSQALDELLAARNQPRNAALVPENDEMVLDNAGQVDVAKTDLYRSEIGQAPVDAQTQQSSSPMMFCQGLVDIQAPFVAANQNVLAAGPSPVPTVGDTLFTFLANRLNMSFTNLGCQNYGLANPVAVVMNGAGAATQATFNTSPQTASNTFGAGAGGGGGAVSTTPAGGQSSLGDLIAQFLGSAPRIGRDGHSLMDPSGE